MDSFDLINIKEQVWRYWEREVRDVLSFLIGSCMFSIVSPDLIRWYEWEEIKDLVNSWVTRYWLGIWFPLSLSTFFSISTAFVFAFVLANVV